MIASSLDVSYFNATTMLLKVECNKISVSIDWNAACKNAARPRYFLDGNHLTFERPTDNQLPQCSIVYTAMY